MFRFRQQYRFDFNLAEKPYESYSGLNVRVRYFVRVTISTKGKNVTRETDFIVQNIQQVNLSIVLEMGGGEGGVRTHLLLVLVLSPLTVKQCTLWGGGGSASRSPPLYIEELFCPSLGILVLLI